MVHQVYGSPGVLELQEVDKPAVADDQVLVRVHAASVNPFDFHFLRGDPFPIRIVAGLIRPKRKIPGVDVAGKVEAVGRMVDRFKAGDEVFGSSPTSGGFAEYLCVPEDAVVLKPANLTYEQAAAVPVAALTALQGLRDHGEIQPGHEVLINGAAGGVGTYAVQIAKSFGAEVTGVCSARNLEMVRSIGADHVIDYDKEDFTQTSVGYDLLLDLVGNHSQSEYRRALRTSGIYVAAAASSVGQMLWMAIAGGKSMVSMLTKPNPEDLGFLKDLLESKKLLSVIDRSYKLSEVPEAMRYLELGHAQGKVVITL
jgi:NADPH:quinone reductase-like Zn-dependent oxidoreductase